MSEKTKPAAFLTTHNVAQRLGCQEWEIRRLFVTRVLPEPPRLGQRRIIAEADLPAIEVALREWQATKGRGRKSTA